MLMSNKYRTSHEQTPRVAHDVCFADEVTYKNGAAISMAGQRPTIQCDVLSRISLGFFSILLCLMQSLIKIYVHPTCIAKFMALELNSNLEVNVKKKIVAPKTSSHSEKELDTVYWHIYQLHKGLHIKLLNGHD